MNLHNIVSQDNGGVREHLNSNENRDPYRFNCVSNDLLSSPNMRFHETITLHPHFSDSLRQLTNGRPLATFSLLLSGISIILDKFCPGNVMIIDTPRPKGVVNGPTKGHEKTSLVLHYDENWALDKWFSSFHRVVEQTNASLDPTTQLSSNSLSSNVIVVNEDLHGPFQGVDDYELIFEIHNRQSLEVDVTSHGKFGKDFARYFAKYFITVIENFYQGGTMIKTMPFFEWQDAAVRIGEKRLYPDTILRVMEKKRAIDLDRIAIYSCDKAISYRTLYETSERLATALVGNYKLSKGDVVSVVCDNDEHLVIAMLGIMKAGGIYMPVDPELSNAAVQEIVKVSKPSLFIVHSAYFGKVSDFSSISTIAIDLQLEDIESPSSSQLPVINAQDTAYLIHTSGTTGVPKGIQMTHGSLTNMIESVCSIMQIGEGVRMAQACAIGFDVSVMEISLSLWKASTLYMIPRKIVRDAKAYVDFLVNNRIDVVALPPSVLNVLDCERFRGMTIYTGGEAPSTPMISRLVANNNRVFNQYGLTETACVSLIESVDNCNTTKMIALGYPVANTIVALLNEEKNVVPFGITAQLYIGGAGINAINERSAKEGSFVRKMIDGEEVLLYGTGDLGWMSPDGKVIFSGRMDGQVKIRGNRVEIEAIESCLLGIPSVVQVKVLPFFHDETFLVAYYTKMKEVSEKNIKEHLTKYLPVYMIPSHFVLLQEMPLSVNGKIDEKALRDIPWEISQVSQQEEMTSIEKRVCGIWEEYLNRKNISKMDNFFEIGGHSLKATQIISKINHELDVQLELTDIFTHSTIQEISGVIKKQKTVHEEMWMPLPANKNYQASHAQKRLWVLDKMDERQTAYNIYAGYRFTGPLNVDAFERALNMVVKRHEILRTRFPETPEGPVQVVEGFEQSGFYLEKLDLTNLSELERDTILQSRISALPHIVFDLTSSSLFNVQLLLLKDDSFVFLMCMHHIIMDGWSIQVLVHDIFVLYEAFEKGRENPLPALKVQYKEFAAWQNERLQNNYFGQEKEYWHSKLKGPLPLLSLPSYKTRPEVQTFNGYIENFKFPNALHGGLTLLVKKHGVSLFTLLTTISNVLLYRYTYQRDILLGTINSGRDNINIQNQIGFFVNTIVLRTTIDPEDTFVQMLYKVKNTIVDAFKNSHYPFDLLVADLDLDRRLNHSPIFDVLIELHSFENLFDLPEQVQGFGGNLSIVPLAMDNRTSIYDMNLIFRSEGDGLFLSVRYNTDVFTSAQILQFWKHFEFLVEQILATPNQQISQFEMVTVEESKELEGFNDTDKNYPDQDFIVQQIENNGRRYPEKVALVDHEEELTYHQMVEMSTSLGAFLISKLSKKESRVGVLMERSVWMAVSMMGIWKAGGCYLPLDHAYPMDRLKYMIEDAGVEILITNKKHIKKAQDLQYGLKSVRHLLCIDTNGFQDQVEDRNNEALTELWDSVEQNSQNDIEGGGWIDSYTGEHFSREEMNEYSENIFLKLKPLLRKDSRILEIGCASGISMYKLAPHVQSYVGTDISGAVIDSNKKFTKEAGITNIELHCLAADEIDRLDDHLGFDIIVINSVLQNFPDYNYLRQVLRKCFRLLKDDAVLFIGDILDLDKKEEFVESLRLFKENGKSGKYITRLNWDSTFFVPKVFFDDLQENPLVTSVAHTEKIFTRHNELTDYHYDTIITVGSKGRSRSFIKNKNQYDLSFLRNPDKNISFPNVRGEDLAYIIYTSGSTGVPKGVMVEHRGMLNHLYGKIGDLKLGDEDVIVQNASQNFDISVWQFIAALLVGGRTIILNDEVITDPSLFIKRVNDHSVSVLELVPSYLDVLMDVSADHLGLLPTLRYLLVTGEAVYVRQLKKWFAISNTPVINAYGPTEASDDITHHFLYECPTESVPIGKPLQNLKIYILDDQLKKCAIGVKGEICVSGVGVGRGYLNDVDKTLEFFMDDPFAGGRRMYKTGDVGRYLPDGCIEFFGRKDDQIKIRGHRIELGELQSYLMKIPSVKNAVALAVADEAGNKSLCAFLSMEDEKNDAAEIKAILSRSLPTYIIPSTFILLREFPLNNNGKVDHNALKELIDPTIKKNVQIGPRTVIEKTIANIWKGILNKTKISINENFFDIGGHSLKAIRVMTAVRQHLHVELTLKDVFASPTIEKLASLVQSRRRKEHQAIPLAPSMTMYPVSHSQKRLWVQDQLKENQIAYNMPGGFILEGQLNVTAFAAAMETVVRRHESLRTIFVLEGEDVFQKVQSFHQLSPYFRYEDASARVNVDQYIDHLISFDTITSFNLTAGPLFRSSLIKANASLHLFFFTMHHIISDGWSMEILERDFIVAYNALCENKEVNLPAIPIQYKDFAYWQNNIVRNISGNHLEKFWLDEFSDEVPVLELPLDFKRPIVKTFQGDVLSFQCEADSFDIVKRNLRQDGRTVFSYLLALVSTLLYRYSGQRDIVLGFPSAGRRHHDLENQIGFYINTIPLRIQFDPQSSFRDVVHFVGDKMLAIDEHESYPLDLLVDKLGVSELFNVMVQIQNVKFDEMESLSLTGLTTKGLSHKLHGGVSKFDLTFNFREDENGALHIDLEYNTTLFLPKTAEKIRDEFVQLFRLTLNTNLPIEELRSILFASNEKSQLDFYRKFSSTDIDTEF